MDVEFKSALFRVLPFAIILFILLLRIRQNKINPHELNLNKPHSANRFLLWTVGFLIFILLTEFAFYKLGILEIEKWNHPLYPSVIRIIGIESFLTLPNSEKAFREALANALVHRTWDVKSAILISMHPNRIEIASPGGLPFGLSKEEYLKTRLS